MRQLDIIVELLRQGKTVKILARGNSMRPYLIHERDYVIMAPPCIDAERGVLAHVGDSVLAEIKPSTYVLHRVVKIDGDKLTLRGDGNIATEHCRLCDVRGRAISFKRKGSDTEESVNSLKYRMYSWFWMRTVPIRSYLLAIHNLLFHSVRNLERVVPNEHEMEVFLSLLQMSLWKGKNDTVAENAATKAASLLHDKPVRWEVIWKFAENQTVTGLITDAVKHLPADIKDAPDSPLKGPKAMQWNMVSMQQLNQHQRINKVLVRTVNFLEEKGFHPILLKGQGVATFYHEPMLRMCGDIDLYIGKKDYEAVCDCIGELVGEEEKKNAELTPKHIGVKCGDIEIELHQFAETQLDRTADEAFQKLTTKWLTSGKTDTVKIGGRDIMIPAPQFNALYIFNHLWRHFIKGGIGLRQICDWSQVLHSAHENIDLNELEHDLRTTHLMHEWQLMGNIAVNKLGLPKEEMPFYDDSRKDKTQMTWDMVIEKGNFGRTYDNIPRESKKHPILGKLKSLFQHTQIAHSLMPFSKRYAFWYMIETCAFGFFRLKKL